MRPPARACLISALILAISCGGGPGDTASDDVVMAPLRLGFDWGNAAKVYVDHWDQRSVKAADPSRPFRVARKFHVGLMRVFVGTDDVIALWQKNPAATIADLRRMLDGARANGVRLVLSARLDQSAIEQLAGHSYDDWGAAQADMVTPGSDAWEGYLAFLRSVIGALGKHPSAWSWEATNEPEWMLGSDAGAVSLDDLAYWLNVTQSAMHDAGAARVNMGGATLEEMSDDQLFIATEFTDVLDAHLYQDDGYTNAADMVASFAAHVARVAALSGRARQAMVGEFGTLNAAWFNAVARASRAHGWPALAWEFDGWDDFWFNDSHHADVLSTISTLNLH